jgi:predicted helicase/very-short-patch-repair endonuclease
MIDKYLKKIASITKRGDAREESYYSALATLIEEFSAATRSRKIQVTVLPKKTEAGNPDFRIWDGKHSQVGYIEAKQPNVNLDEIEDTEQLKRYISTFPNLILTNFYEFRLYRNKRRINKILLARPFIPAKLKAIPPAEHIDEFHTLLENFLVFSIPEQFTAQSLAKELAIRTRFLRDQVIKEELREARTPGAKKILGFYEAFQKHLIANLKPDEFADLYAQTITYGLFAARTRANGAFDRKIAYDLIPKTIGILREIFHFISFDPSEQLQATVDDIAEILAAADVKNILHDYFKDGKGSDPIFHFYETFLAEYNPKERERRGVYYTPEPVVSYIVRSLHIILKEKFGKDDGFASPSVTVLDPAGGTLTFLAEAARLAVQEFVEKYGEGSKSKFIEDHILKHFFAFELMMAPYAAGHLKMGYLLEELGHKLSGEERFQFYLTNTLDMEELSQTTLPVVSALSEESHLAGKVKKDKPILVILGNPPYSGHSANQGEWISDKIEDYKMVDGKPLGEKNPKWLQDDYVKFIRFAQWKIDSIGEGVLGFITNHSYLDNPTFRGMRQSLMNSFDEIHILDLHGNSLKKEKAPDGSKDENVFDIQQGVAIAILIKNKKRSGSKIIKHFELWGEREDKYKYLKMHDIKQGHWHALTPNSPSYWFVPRDEQLNDSYQKFLGIPQIFPVNSVGIVTARDHLAIQWTARDIWTTVTNFASMDPELARAAYELGADVRDWKVSMAQKDLEVSGPNKKNIVPILYRPFDVRFTYYTGKSRGFHCMPRGDVMRHMLQPNLALCVGRAGQVVGVDHDWNIVFCSDSIEDLNLFYRGGNVNFPLYLYQDSKKGDLFANHSHGKRTPNIAPKLIAALNAAYFPSPPSPLPQGEGLGVRAKTGARVYKRKLPEYLLNLCREFRKNPTETETMLWECLRDRRLYGYKFRRQHPIGRYIADFYCHELKLIIEVDGGIHNKKDQKLYDEARQEDLEARGYQVVRLATDEVKRDLPGALGRIIPSPASPLPQGEGSGARANHGVRVEDIFKYIYAILYSPAYRKKYAEFLKTDFPRVPFTNNYELFLALSAKGRQLVDLHLLKSDPSANLVAKCEGKGSLKVEKVSYDARQRRIYINPDKWFEKVESEVWDYHIGGYQVANKWLKDRKGRTLSSEEVATYCKTITAISRTVEIQLSLDELFIRAEKSLLNISF